MQKDNSCAIIKKVRIISIQNIFTKNICTLLILLLRCVIIMTKRERNIRGNREAGKMNMAGINSERSFIHIKRKLFSDSGKAAKASRAITEKG